jgi:transglutaminase-like putative cysteine protease
VGWLMLLLADGRERLSGWGRRLGTRAFAGDPTTDVRSAPEPLGAVGRRVGAVSLALAVVLPALVPGLSEAVFGRGEGLGTGSGTTVQTVNPFVSLGAELNARQDSELFTYRSSALHPGYLALVSLDSFDGNVWTPASLTTSSRVADGPLPLPPGLSATVARSDVTTDVDLSGLAKSTWLPAPYPPVSITMDADRAPDWVWDLTHRVAWSPKSDSQDLSYTVTSLAVQPTRQQLTSLAPLDQDVVAADLDLPAASRATVIDLARQVTAGADTPFEQAVKLQDWFRSEFTYDAEVSPSLRDPLGDFLQHKVGFCQQFAGTFAVMARSLGIPTRVVVGFVPGERRNDGSWQVTAHDVHAWPEVYFQGIGWVRFEPTPRSDNAGVTVPVWGTPGGSGSDPGDSQNASPGVSEGASPGASEGSDVPVQNLPGGEGGSGAFPAIQRQFHWVWALVVLAALFVLLLPYLARRQQRRNRLARTRDWTELAATCADLGRSWPASRTPRQVAQALIGDAGMEQSTPAAADALRRLALATERGRYARTPELVPGLARDVTEVSQGLVRSASRWQVLRARFMPASLLSRAASRTADALDWVDAAPRRAQQLVRREQRPKVGV